MMFSYRASPGLFLCKASNIVKFVSMMCAMLVALATSGMASAQENSPTQVVERFQATLTGIMQEADALGYQGRYERLKPALEQSHDLPGIARFVLGRHWKDLDAGEQTAFTDALTQLSIATYAARFDHYSGETFATVEAQPLPIGDVLVRSLFTESDGNKIAFDYTLRRAGDAWRIINIIVDGVSDLAIKRAEYTTILRKDGIAALIERLNRQTTQYTDAEGT